MEVNDMTATDQQTVAKPLLDALLPLLDKVSEEIATYRQRQITIFREAAIVEALITWGVNQLKPQQNTYGTWIRVTAAAACFGASIIGSIIIMSYKERIYLTRNKRAELIKIIQEESGTTSEPIELFYPTTKRAGTGLWSKLLSIPTSTVYSLSLMILGILAFIVNLVAGHAILANPIP